MASDGHFLKRHICTLIQNITMVMPALDEMRQAKLLTDEQYDLVASKETTQGQMREIYRHMKDWSHCAMDNVYECLKKTNPVVVANAEGRPLPVMASDGLREKLNILDINRDPVTITHGYSCRENVLYEQGMLEAYTSPKYRTEFEVKASNPAEGFPCTYAESGVFCTNCKHVPADEPCMSNEASLCDKHLRVHSMSAEQILCEPIISMENRKYQDHKKMEDASSSCIRRLERDYNQEEALIRASVMKKRKLRNILEKLLSEREDTKKKAQCMWDYERGVEKKVADIIRRVTVLFGDVRRKLEVLENRILSEVSRQKEQVSLNVSDLIQQLDIKMDELSRKMCYIEQLCNVTDPLIVLKEHESGKDSFSDTEEVESDNIQTHDVGHLDEGLISATFHTGLSDIITGIKRGIYMQELTDVVLDVDTAENHILISDDLKTASWSQTNLNRPEVPERFNYSQVLTTSGFSSVIHYWEVETSETGAWRIGMSYSSVGRKGEQASIGNNDKSWCLCKWLYNMQYAVLHNREAIELDHNISCRRFGIYLDYAAGRLSFYGLCNPTRHLHTFTTTFTEPLYAAIYVWDRECDKDCWVRIRSYEK
ncbi:tripartite motif-containing protein 14-like [Pseudophryne corroboree]|uniref:tripartite motif-containing protein 14-like n=1 Tax=Pseudophryne corroboree TaxID=495146 RepID=UPI00308151E7